MELAKSEVVAIEKILEEANAEHVRELLDLQLAFAGGGIADPVAF